MRAANLADDFRRVNPAVAPRREIRECCELSRRQACFEFADPNVQGSGVEHQLHGRIDVFSTTHECIKARSELARIDRPRHDIVCPNNKKVTDEPRLRISNDGENGDRITSPSTGSGLTADPWTVPEQDQHVGVRSRVCCHEPVPDLLQKPQRRLSNRVPYRLVNECCD
jgi:hypothetical protein